MCPHTNMTLTHLQDTSYRYVSSYYMRHLILLPKRRISGENIARLFSAQTSVQKISERYLERRNGELRNTVRQLQQQINEPVAEPSRRKLTEDQILATPFQFSRNGEPYKVQNVSFLGPDRTYAYNIKFEKPFDTFNPKAWY